MTAPTATAVSFGELLGLLCYTSSELVSLGYEAADGSWHTAVMAPADAVVAAAAIPTTANTYFGVCAVKGPARKNAGRGKEADVTRLSGLWCDIDVKPGCCKSLDVALAIVANLGIILGTRPTVIVRSGHGIHAYWPITDGHIVGGDVAWARALIRRWHRLVAAVAKKLDVAVDSVYDLPRMLRVPGSLNNKGTRGNGSTAPLVTAERQPASTPLTVDEVSAVLDRVGVTELPEDRTAAGAQQVSAPKDWVWSFSTCGYFAKMVDGWETETPTERHPWLMSCYVRLACAHRHGCLTEADYQRARRVVDERFDWLTRNTDPKREPRQYEIAGAAHSALEWGITNAAAKTDAQVSKELGGHSHTAASAKPRPQHKDFWEHSEELRKVRDWARSRLVSPWATLGSTLARVVTTVPTTVQIYPYVGREASLNLYFGLVGLSGLGKGGPEGTARDALHTAGIYVTGPGSAEGLNHLFAHYDKQSNTTVFDRHAAYFTVPEVDTLAGLAGRSGSTLLAQLCKAWSGESLTFAYADVTKRLVIPNHSYRLAMVVGIQPERAGVLFDAADSGVPQRFVWLPTDDPDVPDDDVPPPERIDRGAIGTNWPKDVTILELPPTAAAIVKTARRRQLRGKTVDASLDGHLPLCRTKLAAALMLLHDERQITMEHWDLAGVVMDVSNDTRARVQEQLAARTLRDVKRRGHHEGVRAVESAEVQTAAAVKRVASGITRYLGANGGEAARGEVRKKAITSRLREHFEEALASLVAASLIEVVSSAHGERLKLVVP